MVRLTGCSWFTVMHIWLEVAGLPVRQAALEVKTQVMQSPLAGVYVNICPLVPVLTPLTFHCQDGEVPVGFPDAEKVTGVPAQTVVLLQVIPVLYTAGDPAKSWTVSLLVHPFRPVTFTRYRPAVPVV